MPEDDLLRLDPVTPAMKPKKRWSSPTVIESEIETTDKLFEVVEISLLPTGPS
jgi:hypothetical protein